MPDYELRVDLKQRPGEDWDAYTARCNAEFVADIARMNAEFLAEHKAKIDSAVNPLIYGALAVAVVCLAIFGVLSLAT